MSFKSWFDGLNIWIKIILIIFLIIAYPIGIIFLLAYIISWRSAQKDKSPTEEFEKYLEQKEKLKEEKAKLILQKDEKILYSQPSDFYEERAIRNYVRTGHSFRIMKGWWYHMGSGQAESHGELRKIDSGSLYITNKKFIFNGPFKNYNYSYTKLLSVEPSIDSVRIAVDGRQRTLTFTTDNPLLLGASLQNLAGVNMLEKEAVEYLENELKKTIVSKVAFFGPNINVNIGNFKEMSEALRLYSKSIDVDINDYVTFVKKAPVQINTLKSKINKFADVLEDFDYELNKVKNRLGEKAGKETIEKELDKFTDKKYGKTILKDSLIDIISFLNDLSPGIINNWKAK